MKNNQYFWRTMSFILFIFSIQLYAQELTEKETQDHLDEIKSGGLYGNYSEYDKFVKLEKACESLKKTKHKKLVIDTLLLEIEKIKVIEDQPTNWNNFRMDMRGGNTGLLIYTYLGLSDEQGFTRLYNSVLKKNDPLKMKALLKITNYRKEGAKHTDFLNKSKEKVISEEIKEIIELHLEKVAEIEKEKAKEEEKKKRNR